MISVKARWEPQNRQVKDQVGTPEQTGILMIWGPWDMRTPRTDRDPYDMGTLRTDRRSL